MIRNEASRERHQTRPVYNLPDSINDSYSLSGGQISDNYSIYRSVQRFASCAEDQILQDFIFRTRLCGGGFITQHG